jgi:hypothetical protein
MVQSRGHAANTSRSFSQQEKKKLPLPVSSLALLSSSLSTPYKKAGPLGPFPRKTATTTTHDHTVKPSRVGSTGARLISSPKIPFFFRNNRRRSFNIIKIGRKKLQEKFYIDSWLSRKDVNQSTRPKPCANRPNIRYREGSQAPNRPSLCETDCHRANNTTTTRIL